MIPQQLDTQIIIAILRGCRQQLHSATVRSALSCYLVPVVTFLHGC